MITFAASLAFAFLVGFACGRRSRLSQASPSPPRIDCQPDDGFIPDPIDEPLSPHVIDGLTVFSLSNQPFPRA